jgi:hypothetical protein
MAPGGRMVETILLLCGSNQGAPSLDFVCRGMKVQGCEGQYECQDYMHCGIQEPKAKSGLPQVEIKTVWEKSLPLAGKVVDVHWVGIDFGLLDPLYIDSSLRNPMATRNHEASQMSFLTTGPRL